MSGKVAIYNPKDEKIMMGEEFSLKSHPCGQNMFLTLSEDEAEVFGEIAIHHFIFYHKPENSPPPEKAFRVIKTGTIRGICKDDGSVAYDIVVEELSQAEVPTPLENL